jgi:diguanylate cyclase (GGDEF)-like protein
MEPKHFKEKVAIFLNDHPEFFNFYPDLLTKIKSIEIEDLPLAPAHSMSVANKIIQTVRDDREHYKGKLDWFLEIANKNEIIHDHLHEIEKLALSSSDLPSMLTQLKKEITKRFDIQFVAVWLVNDLGDLSDLGIEDRYPEPIDGSFRFVERDTLEAWFGDNFEPQMRSEIDGDSRGFCSPRDRDRVQSEALIPIIIRGELSGFLALGSENSFHFYEELDSGFLTKMAGKLAIALENIFLWDRLKELSYKNPVTGFYDRTYLEVALSREFERSKRYRNFLTCAIMCIDYFDNLEDTEAISRKLFEELTPILSEACRSMDIVLHYDERKFFFIFPEASLQSGNEIAERIRSCIESAHLEVPGLESVTASFGISTFPNSAVKNWKDLIQNALKGLTKANENGGNQAVAYSRFFNGKIASESNI